jgi:GAF domain-containing protein
MAETLLDVRAAPKPEAYRQLRAQLAELLRDETDAVAAMATMSCVLHHGFGHLWTGFYRVIAPGTLAVGPYQGSLGCMRIAIGRGVCGTAAARRETQVVPDVHAFPGHIACDGRSASEIVVPVFDAAGALIAVLDLDSDRKGAFDGEDATALEALVAWFAGKRIEP